ncbi:MAG TPA: trehalose-phosphatase [Ramlibacter sp.]|nr:trehalose-phosphatase [Ramlibacter sp.]
MPGDKNHLLGPDGEEALASTMRLRPLLAFDFDGTLAPIVPRPGAARISVALARRLDMLSRLLPVAVITGRSVDDVAPRLGFRPQFVIGNHGAEDPAMTASDAGAELESLRSHLRSRAEGLKAAGVEVEDKTYSIALHYRLASDRPKALDTIRSVLSETRGNTKAFGGKCVVNIVPENAPDKADAVENLVRRCASAGAIFVGDDVNDEAVFIRSQPTWLTVRVGRDDRGSQARYFLDNITEVGMMLQRMLDLAAST